MCGIVAILGLPPSSERTLRLHAMAASISHRGPDSDGFFEGDSLAFGFRRLAILDLSPAGNQPMSTDDGALTIVFNGEIYNFIELRTELEALGHCFHSHSDTEVLLHAYQEWGEECVQRFNGMWAFLIFDRRTRKLVGSRDRFGIKPLYSANAGSQWVFASEIKALLASGLITPEPNWAIVADYFVRDEIDHSESTFFNGVRNVPPATWFEIDSQGRYREKRFWCLAHQDSEEPRPEAAEEFAALFDDAMRLHRRSDVPLAVHLSGGLDSTSILCSLARAQMGEGRPLNALAFMSDEFDERRYIADTISQTKAELHKLTVSANDLWDMFPDALAAHDEPFHSMTALVSYALMRETRSDGIKVVLNGQGADETLAGYGSYFTGFWHEILRAGHISSAFAQMRRYAEAHGKPVGLLFARQVAFTLRAIAGRNTWYRGLAERRSSIGKRHWASGALLGNLTRQPHVVWDLSLKQRLALSIEKDPLPLYLRVEDRNAMAHSIESRVPFLDHRLVELAMGLPSNELLEGGWNKWLLRRAMRHRIPDSVRLRIDKMGFPVPTATWLRGPLWRKVSEALNDDVVRRSGIVDTVRMDAEIAAFQRGDDRPAARLFETAQFALWWHRVLKAPVPSLAKAAAARAN